MKRRFISSVLAAGMLTSAFAGMSIITASAADIGDTWKFDFGPDNQTVASGYYGVTPSTEFNATDDNGFRYGLVGQNSNDYKMQSYEDGVSVTKGQVVNYAGSGSGSAASNDRVGIGTLDANQTDGIYPIRFAMDAENNSYYEVKVNVTTLDSSKPAQGVFVYSERRHPIVTNQTIAAGATKTVTFRATVQSVLVKDRANGGSVAYTDQKLNVLVMGDNAAISSIEVEKIDPSTTKTIWCYDDSTGCDYSMALPYFPLQNYGGTAQYLSKYLPNNVVLVNQGDGGLASGATSYFNLCKANFKSGDYVYLQYGHNESSAAGYLKNLPTYYKAAHAVGATMVYAGPIDRHNSSQYTASTNTWSSTLSGISDTAKKYTEILICAGADAGDTFVTKAQTSWDDANAYYDEIIEGGITSSGVTDVAFVDLNARTISWLSTVCEEVKTAQNAGSYSASYSNYYFRSQKGSSVDGTHENDYGADATASFFFDGINAKASSSSAIEAVEYAALSPLVTNMRTAYGSWDHANTDYYTNGVYTAGSAPNSMWPDVFKSTDAAAYPTTVKSVEWNSDGTISSVTIVKQESTMSMDDYGMLKLDIYDKNNTLKGTIKSSQVDNTWGDGTTTVFSVGDENYQLTGDTSAKYVKADGDTYTATIYRASKGDGSELEYITPLEAYSETYVPTNYEGTLITNEDGDRGEDFNYYGSKYDGSASAYGKNGWMLVGSATKSANLYAEDGVYYATVTTAASGSMNLYKKILTSPSVKSNGILNMSVDLRNASGRMQFTLASGYSTNWPSGETLTMFTIRDGKVYANGSTLAGDVSGSSWQTVTAEADLDRGTITVKVGSSDAVTVNVANLQKNIDFHPTSLAGLCIAKNGNYTGSVDVTNIIIDKYTSDDELDTKTLTFAKNGSGSVQVNGAAANSVSVAQSQPVTVKAVPADFYTFTNWTDADGNVLSTEATYTYPRVYQDATITANFTSNYGEGYTAEYITGFTEDFEGSENIFGATDIVDTTEINSNSIFGNVLRLSGATFSHTATLSSPVSLRDGQYVELSFNQFNPYLSGDKDVTFGLYDDNDKALVSYAYNAASTSITSVKIGDSTPEDFESFSWSTANSWNQSGRSQYDFTKSTNPGLVTIKVNGDKTVTITFANCNGKETKEYSGTLTDDVSVKYMTFAKSSGGNNNQRTVGLDNFVATLVSAPDTTVADYTLSADKQYVSTADGTVNLTVSGATNADGDTLSDVDASSATYSCSESGVTISDAGVVTIGSGFDMGGAEFKTVTVTATIGSVSKTVSFKVHEYAFYDDFADSKVSATWNGDMGTISSKPAIIYGAGYSSAVTNTLTLPTAISLADKTTVIEFTNAGSGAAQTRTLTLKNSSGSNVLTQGAMSYKWAELTVGSTVLSSAMSKTTITINSDGTGTVKIGDNSADIALASGITDLASFSFYSKASQGNYTMGWTDVKITQTAAAEEPETTLQDEVNEGSGSVTITGDYNGEDAEVPANMTVTIGESGSIKNGTLTAEGNGRINVVVDGSTISGAKSVQFDGSGKVTPADGAVISTTNKANAEKYDKGFFVTKSAKPGEALNFTINGKEKTAAYNGSVEGDVLFGVFVLGIPANTDVTVE